MSETTSPPTSGKSWKKARSETITSLFLNRSKSWRGEDREKVCGTTLRTLNTTTRVSSDIGIDDVDGS